MRELMCAITVLLSLAGISSVSAQHPPLSTVPLVRLDLEKAMPVFDSALPESFSWKLTNISPVKMTIDGDFHVTVDGKDASANGLPKIQGLGQSAQRSGKFSVGPLLKGSHTITVKFLRTQVTNIPHHPPRVRGSLAASQTLTFNVVLGHGPIVDNDQDKLDDDFEHRLLEHYRPFFRFSKPAANDKAIQGRLDDAEPFPPIEFADYMKFSQAVRVIDKTATAPHVNLGCQILQQPKAFAAGDLSPVLQLNAPSNDTSLAAKDTCSPDGCVSDIIINKRKTTYAFHPVAMPTFGQSDMDHAAQVGNVGLYGHIVPYDPCSDVKCTGRSNQGWQRLYFWNFNELFIDDDVNGTRRKFVKVEYWQFFPFNGDAAPHEGDWDSVQLIIDLNSPTLPPLRLHAPTACQSGPQTGFGLIASIFHYHHGDESRFDFANCNNSSPTGQPGIVEFTESNGEKVQLFQDTDGNLTHPVVYIEYGSHEFWPTTAGYATGAPNHNGDGTSYLTATPPNLGEVEAPLGEYIHAKELMRFNGFWGACCGVNWAPPGPTLHTEWTWPESSKIGLIVNSQAEP